PAAHPNSRFTSPAKNSPVISNRFASKYGVPISAIIFGGRRAQTTPLVCEARDWNHGVFMGSTIASEKTAAATGVVGELRRDPMAMIPFCGYNMANYFEHWLKMGKLLREKSPKIFNVNWFRTDEDGNFIWPGFGDNLRVLNWILDRCDNKVEAIDSPIGLLPKIDDIDIEDLEISKETISELLNINKDSWANEILSIKEFYAKFGETLPTDLNVQLNILEENIDKM
ncbi:MAG: phosphoenolpyruvate carboxykinase domain-containing protein, partial [Bacilli bacterium]